MLKLNCKWFLKVLEFGCFNLVFVKAGGTVFDASQYAFFGNDVVEEVELGGLEDEEDAAPVGFEEEEFQLEVEQVAF